MKKKGTICSDFNFTTYVENYKTYSVQLFITSCRCLKSHLFSLVSTLY